MSIKQLTRVYPLVGAHFAQWPVIYPHALQYILTIKDVLCRVMEYENLLPVLTLALVQVAEKLSITPPKTTVIVIIVLPFLNSTG